ncbi:carbonate dehydratase [Parvibium lacunae]|uniref:Carbonic anhydrase n=1 Tax=Parvibium lacunae TaxID=1888893 RepID=A0A368L0P0_9BURK|nr:carbonate dehydratase [Parvibium lacunae]RCS56861.1 carbonate dehydratase [Parvibium lacunae]
MRTLPHLFNKNRDWAEHVEDNMPGFFNALAEQQHPEYLWIGCSDSRVPANEIVGLLPGELFVHRNVANVVVHTDINCLSVIQYAVDILKIKHIIVCGHYGCGGVRAAIDNQSHGLIDNWLRHIQEIRRSHHKQLSPICQHEHKVDRLCELNVMRQALNVGQTTIVQDAWRRAQPLEVHAWIYGISDGLIKDLGLTFANADELQRQEAAFAALQLS